MIERVRPTPDAAELAKLYAHPNDADQWHEHTLRVNLTVELARYRFNYRPLIIDPAAGAGRTVRDLVDDYSRVITGDLAPEANVTNPATDALELLRDVDLEHGYNANALVILGEILEHVDDPHELLAAARRVAGGLILSTPLDEPAGINPEHVWRWDRDGITGLLVAAGWRPLDYVAVELPPPAGWPHIIRTQLHTAEAGELLKVAA